MNVEQMMKTAKIFERIKSYRKVFVVCPMCGAEQIDLGYDATCDVCDSPLPRLLLT